MRVSTAFAALAWVLLTCADKDDSPKRTRGYRDCGGVIRENEGRIGNYIGPRTHCVWVIEVKPGQHIAMAIPSLNLTCANEEVELLDGPPGSRSLGKYCEGLYLKFYSSTNCVTIKYSRVPSHPPSSFDVYFYGVQAGRDGGRTSY